MYYNDAPLEHRQVCLLEKELETAAGSMCNGRWLSPVWCWHMGAWQVGMC